MQSSLDQDNLPFGTHMFAGSLAGLAQHISLLPIDNVKTQCQASKDIPTRVIIQNIYQKGGLSNFYSGSGIIAATCIPAHALYFAAYQQMKNFLGCSQEDSFKYGLVGLTSSLFHDLIMTPSQVIKQRLQIVRSHAQWSPMKRIITDIYRKEGIVAFYRSFGVNYLINTPFHSTLVMLNQKLKVFFKAKDADSKLIYYLCGGLAGILTAIPTAPFDVIKTKLNTQVCIQCDKVELCSNYSTTSKGNVSIKAPKAKAMYPAIKLSYSQSSDRIKYHNLLDTPKIIYKEEGMAGFFKGVKLRMCIQSFSAAISWGTFHTVTDFLNGKNKHKH